MTTPERPVGAKVMPNRPGPPDAGFPVREAFRKLREAAPTLPPAAMFELRNRGFGSPYEALVGTLISARTRDSATLSICLRLFAVARTPERMLRIPGPELADLLNGAMYRETKARDVLELSRRIVEEHGGEVPDTMEGLMAFRGVGPKIAALTLAIGFGKPAVCVDVHVHRIVNRWGLVATTTPEATMLALERVVPEDLWIAVNERLVPLGKAICAANRPKCPRCPVRDECRRVGVTEMGA